MTCQRETRDRDRPAGRQAGRQTKITGRQTHVAARVQVGAEPDPPTTGRHEIHFGRHGGILRRAVDVKFEESSVVRSASRCRDHRLRRMERTGGGKGGGLFGSVLVATAACSCCCGLLVFTALERR